MKKLELTSEEIDLMLNSLKTEKKTMQDFISKKSGKEWEDSAIRYISKLNSIINKLKQLWNYTLNILIQTITKG